MTFAWSRINNDGNKADDDDDDVNRDVPWANALITDVTFLNIVACIVLKTTEMLHATYVFTPNKSSIRENNIKHQK